MAFLTNTFYNWVDGLCKHFNCTFKRLLYSFIVLIFASRQDVRQQLTRFLLLPSSLPKANSSYTISISLTQKFGHSHLFFGRPSNVYFLSAQKPFYTRKQEHLRPQALLWVAVPTKQSIILYTASYFHVTIAHR